MRYREQIKNKILNNLEGGIFDLVLCVCLFCVSFCTVFNFRVSR